MNILDILVIILLIVGAIVGYRQGFTKSLVNCVGLIAVIILSFLLKNTVSKFLMLNLPFFDFWGMIKGVSVLNIVMYETIAFILVMVVLFLVLKILLVVTTVFEKILQMTIILGVPSKILGAIFGIIKYYDIAFIIMYILALPTFADSDIVKNSKFQKPILENTVVLSTLIDRSLTVYDEFSVLGDKYKENEDKNGYNFEALDLFLKHDLVKLDTVKELVQKGKIKIDNVEKILDKYKE
ncbi:MAG: CvpA family protein [Bacilli bacterium]|nr:CvpA family protein [Bacilli bacterium]